MSKNQGQNDQNSRWIRAVTFAGASEAGVAILSRHVAMAAMQVRKLMAYGSIT